MTSWTRFEGSASIGFLPGQLFLPGMRVVAMTRLPDSNPEGAVYCWGDNSYGQRGDSWATSSFVPVNVA